MGISKQQLSDKEDEKFNANLAAYLGISLDELLELDIQWDEEVSEDGFIYNYILKIAPEGPKRIISKIAAIDTNYQVWIPASEYQAL